LQARDVDVDRAFPTVTSRGRLEQRRPWRRGARRKARRRVDKGHELDGLAIDPGFACAGIGDAAGGLAGIGLRAGTARMRGIARRAARRHCRRRRLEPDDAIGFIPRAVSMMTGMRCPASRSLRSTASPSIPGIITSSNTASKPPAASAAIPACPPPAWTSTTPCGDR
jgi:hypothetical protein